MSDFEEYQQRNLAQMVRKSAAGFDEVVGDLSAADLARRIDLMKPDYPRFHIHASPTMPLGKITVLLNGEQVWHGPRSELPYGIKWDHAILHPDDYKRLMPQMDTQ